MKIFLAFPNTVHITLASAWRGLAIGSRTDLRSVRITHYTKQLSTWNRKKTRSLSPSPFNFWYR